MSTFSCLEPAGYIGEFEIVDDHRSGKVVIDLIGRINKCGVISPRFDLKLAQIEQWTSNLLPSRQFGYVVLTTSLGIMDHEEVRSRPTSGDLCRPKRNCSFTCALQK
jgi:small subunit ribosomal protein S15Ae